MLANPVGPASGVDKTHHPMKLEEPKNSKVARKRMHSLFTNTQGMNQLESQPVATGMKKEHLHEDKK